MEKEILVMFLLTIIQSTQTIHVTSFYKIARPQDCQDLWDAGLRHPGVYKIFPANSYMTEAYCAHNNVGTATVIQRRSDGNVSFYRNWQDYKTGFGDRKGDHWIGLEALHLMTYTRQMKLDITMEDWSHNIRIMTYDHVYIGEEYINYRLILGNAYGQLIDDMAYSNNTQFATFDHPDYYSCAINQMAGWWYNYCSYTLLNGVYYYGGGYTPPGRYYNGIYWKDWHGYNYSLKTVTMSLRNR